MVLTVRGVRVVLTERLVAILARLMDAWPGFVFSLSLCSEFWPDKRPEESKRRSLGWALGLIQDAIGDDKYHRGVHVRGNRASDTVVWLGEVKRDMPDSAGGREAPTEPTVRRCSPAVNPAPLKIAC
jgi:hypothetical protein